MNRAVIREVAYASREYLAACELREELLRCPLGLRLTEQDRAGEESHFHLVAECEGKVVGCLVLEPLTQGELKMRQVAVAPDWQRRGLGSALVSRAELLGRERGARSMVLHARTPIVGFYERLGYAVEGEPFVEVTIMHRRMRKAL